MPERTIAHKAFTYSVPAPHPTEPDKTILTERLARRGDTVDLDDRDVKRGEEHGAFVPEGQVLPEIGAPVDTTVGSDDHLDDYVREHGVSEIVEHAGGDPTVARRLLDAENRVTGNDPRSTLVDGLGAVISRGNE